MCVQRLLADARRAFWQLELFELLGMCALSAVIVVFVTHAALFAAITGMQGNPPVLCALAGVLRTPSAWLLAVSPLLLAVVTCVFRRSRHDPWRQWAFLVRTLLSFSIVLLVYKAVIAYVAAFNPMDRDAVLRMIDQHLFFGMSPAQWFDQVVWPPVTGLLCCAYASWFVLVYATVWVLLHHSQQAAAEYASTAVLTFYIGYLTYLLVPAAGPAYTMPFRHSLGGLVQWFIHGQVKLARDCFPSLHTGISVIMLTYIWRYRRRLVWVYAPVTGLILCSTMYLRFHYGIDVIAGGALGLAMTQVAPVLWRAWEQERWRVQASEPVTVLPSSVPAPVQSVAP